MVYIPGGGAVEKLSGTAEKILEIIGDRSPIWDGVKGGTDTSRLLLV